MKIILRNNDNSVVPTTYTQKYCLHCKWYIASYIPKNVNVCIVCKCVLMCAKVFMCVCVHAGV